MSILELRRVNNEQRIGCKKTGGTQGTEGTTSNDEACSGSLEKNDEGTGGTLEALAVDPRETKPETLKKVDIVRPCFVVEDDYFEADGKTKWPGVWYFYETAGTDKKPPANVDLWISSPLHIDGITNTDDGKFFGRLLRWQNGQSRLD